MGNGIQGGAQTASHLWSIFGTAGYQCQLEILDATRTCSDALLPWSGSYFRINIHLILFLIGLCFYSCCCWCCGLCQGLTVEWKIGVFARVTVGIRGKRSLEVELADPVEFEAIEFDRRRNVHSKSNAATRSTSLHSVPGVRSLARKVRTKGGGVYGSKYAILTPDFDVYIEDFSRDNPDIDALRLIAANGNVPLGVDPAETYRFRRMPNANELRNAMIEAQAEIDAELIRDGVFPETGVWISLETIGNVKRGDDVVLSANATILGSRAIDALTIEGNEVNYCCALVDADKKDEFRIALGVELEVDARTLPIKRQGDLRHRDFREGVLAMSFTRFDDWKVVGPRTAKWCLDFLVKRGGPLAHHEWWKSTARLSVVDVGVSEHETCMRIIETAVEYDQIDMLNVCSLEHVFRKAQLWEHYHRERVRKELTTTDKKDKAVIDVEEQQIFLGAHSSDSALMVSPELQEWVAKELEKLAQIDKQARKAREERALRK